MESTFPIVSITYETRADSYAGGDETLKDADGNSGVLSEGPGLPRSDEAFQNPVPSDVASVLESLADRVRVLLRTRLVSVLLRGEGPFELRAVSAENPQLAVAFRAAHNRQTIRFAADLAQRAAAAGEAIAISISTDQPSLGSLVSPGILIAAPFRTARTQGAIL
ncbi:MAG TPA: hypothetical protein VMF10_16595, partial [Candidatus Aquilonibacter sp.]|nr:hypothetical protein [Candidatus Aquilonibacter sp.]